MAEARPEAVMRCCEKKISAKPAFIAAASLATSSMNALVSATSVLMAVSPHA